MTLRATLEEIARSGKRVLVVGLGIRGIESARFLARLGLMVLVAERQSEVAFREASKYEGDIQALSELGIEVSFGVDGEGVAPKLADVGLVLVSPGVSLESSIMGTVKRLGVPCVSELELGVQLHRGQSVVVTGSNGKSTTSALIEHIIRTGGGSAARCSNAGASVVSHAELLDGSDGGTSVLLVEASSYQLESSTVLHPAVSVILNISENHLERHGSLERYASAKARVLRLQSNQDFAALNGDDPVVFGMAKSCRAQIGLFGQRPPTEMAKVSSTWAHISYSRSPWGSLEVCFEGALESYATEASRLRGSHNRYNMAAAVLVSRRLGIPQKVIQEALDTFSPLEHRLEEVSAEARIKVINDSKSTSVAASVAALSTVKGLYKEQQVLLLIGGLSKAGSWSPLLAEVLKDDPSRIRVICFGKDAHLLASHCRSQGICPEVCGTLREATHAALSAVSDGGVLLLSPGCASFDEFADFEHRGREFKRYVCDYFNNDLKATA
jgi:UDP-N-acetylmuramoylalanine--D-glutamate ligase